MAVNNKRTVQPVLEYSRPAGPHLGAQRPGALCSPLAAALLLGTVLLLTTSVTSNTTTDSAVPATTAVGRKLPSRQGRAGPSVITLLSASTGSMKLPPGPALPRQALPALPGPAAARPASPCAGPGAAIGPLHGSLHTAHCAGPDAGGTLGM